VILCTGYSTAREGKTQRPGVNGKNTKALDASLTQIMADQGERGKKKKGTKRSKRKRAGEVIRPKRQGQKSKQPRYRYEVGSGLVTIDRKDKKNGEGGKKRMKKKHASATLKQCI